MRVTRIAVACAALLSLTAAPTRAGLIANGSFESPTVPAGGFSNFAGGSTGITGWTVVGDGVSIVSGTFCAERRHIPGSRRETMARPHGRRREFEDGWGVSGRGNDHRSELSAQLLCRLDHR